MDAATARLLVSPEGRALVDSLPPYDASASMTLGSQLRSRGARPDLVAAALTQSRLRADARAKFGDFAAGMFFTQDGLEQATRLTVAAEHARRFKEARVARVVDLTAGIGADALAFAGLGLDVTAFELDEATALLADHNLRHWEHARVVHADSMVTVPHIDSDPGSTGIFADPARRTARGRRHDPRDYAPPLDEVLGLRAQFPALGVKVGPAIDHADIPDETEAQWVSVDGSVVEAALWCGPLADLVGHSALVMGPGGAHRLSGSTEHADAGPLSEYVYEPDGAVIRAGLVGEVAAQLNGHLVDASIAYVTATAPVETPFARGYRVLEVLPFKVKQLAAALRARNVGAADIKKRGVDITPEQLRPQLKLRGTERATVIVTRVAGQRTALIAEPLNRP